MASNFRPAIPHIPVVEWASTTDRSVSSQSTYKWSFRVLSTNYRRKRAWIMDPMAFKAWVWASLHWPNFSPPIISMMGFTFLLKSATNGAQWLSFPATDCSSERVRGSRVANRRASALGPNWY